MSEEIKMLPIRQNEIVKKITQHGFRKGEFKFTPTNNSYFVLNYSKYTSFIFSYQNNKYNYSPSVNGNLQSHGTGASFETALKQLDVWLKAIKENVEIGNPWEEIENMKEEMNDINFNSYEEMFNEEDRKTINTKLDVLLLEMGKLNIASEEVKTDIDHLKTMSDKISKKDFILLFLGTITGWIFNGIIAPENSQSVWDTVKKLFSNFKFKLLS